MKTINYAIDLGTTNSLIAKFNGVGVDVFKNPVGFRETLPSCIAFRGERILVGDKAREWQVKDPLNVFSGFKRKMGTVEQYTIPSTGKIHTPIAFSSLILNELKNFIHSGEIPESIVITIPASFDTTQSNATKKAGYEAGFKEVLLLQEPIAASLAFFNHGQSKNDSNSGQWLVYDLGGGTFDVALISIEENEMKVRDHIGDNFLGGLDFDHLFVMNCIVPKIIEHTKIVDFGLELNKKDGVYERLYHILLLKAEEAKKELTQRETTEIELTMLDKDGKEIELILQVTTKELNSCIASKIGMTISMIEEILEKNSLVSSDISEIIMVGGSTYIPYLRDQVEARTGIRINCSADPTTAVVIGAGYYAGSKVATPLSVTEIVPKEAEQVCKVDLGYNPTTNSLEEYIAGKAADYDGYYYRIARTDGAFDSGYKKLSARFGEFVPLRHKMKNTFTFKIYDSNYILLENSSQTIEIFSGLFNVAGQPLPEDISIEVDDFLNNTTKCQLLFERNSILPLATTIYREMSRTIRRGSQDQLIVNLLEGNHLSNPISNQVIGFIEINGQNLANDLVKGSDVEIRITISESRDVSVKVNLLLLDYEVAEVFSPSEKYVSVSKLREELKEMRSQINSDIEKLTHEENYERASDLNEFLKQVKDLHTRALSINDLSISDDKYQLDEQKRKLAQAYFNGDNSSFVFKLKNDYYTTRDLLSMWMDSFVEISPSLKEEFETIKKGDTEIMNSKNQIHIKAHLKNLNKLYNRTIYYTPPLLIHFYHSYANRPDTEFEDPQLKNRLVEQGERALEMQNYDDLRGVLMGLVSNSVSEVSIEKIKGTGLA